MIPKYSFLILLSLQTIAIQSNLWGVTDEDLRKKFTLASREYNLFHHDSVAVDLWHQIVADAPTSEFAHSALLNLGKYYLSSKLYSQAEDYFLKLYGNFPDSRLAPDSMYLHAICLKEMGKKTEAINILQKMISFYGRNTPANLKDKLAQANQLLNTLKIN